MPKCLLYARVSTEKQAQKDLSIPAQIKAMRDFAEKQNFKVVGEYIDEGKSAKTINRPQLKRLLERCKKDKIDVVLVHKIDRLARNLVDHATIKALLKQRGIKLVSVVEKFEDSVAGQLVENIMASIAEFYSANLGEEVKKGLREKLRRGEFPGRPPFGYKIVRDKNNRPDIIRVPEKADLVKMIFDMYATGDHSLISISKRLFSTGVQTKSGRRLSAQRILNILTGRFYIGKMVWAGKEYPGKHKPIVSKKLFYRVQGILRERGRLKEKSSKHKFLLRELAYCKTCGRKLTAERHPRGDYYRCIRPHDAEKCSERYIPVKLLEGQLEALYERLQPPIKALKAVKMLLETKNEERLNKAKKKVGRLKKLISQTEAKAINLADQLVAGNITPETYKKMSERYAKTIRITQEELSTLDRSIKKGLDFIDKCIAISSCLFKLHSVFNLDQKRTLARAVFKGIFCQRRQIVGVEFNPPFGYLLDKTAKGLFKERPAGAVINFKPNITN
ncbi:recombinase family protein [bacterium]|nr:MAG: recombinase family protein [bacterium]